MSENKQQGFWYWVRGFIASVISVSPIVLFILIHCFKLFSEADCQKTIIFFLISSMLFIGVTLESIYKKHKNIYVLFSGLTILLLNIISTLALAPNLMGQDTLNQTTMTTMATFCSIIYGLEVRDLITKIKTNHIDKP